MMKQALIDIMFCNKESHYIKRGSWLTIFKKKYFFDVGNQRSLFIQSDNLTIQTDTTFQFYCILEAEYRSHKILIYLQFNILPTIRELITQSYLQLAKRNFFFSNDKIRTMVPWQVRCQLSYAAFPTTFKVNNAVIVMASTLFFRIFINLP